MKLNFKSIYPHLIAIALFLVLTVVYFSPIVFENKDLVQGDVKSYIGWGNDAREYNKASGETVYWSNAMFSGMPTNYAFPPKTNNIFKHLERYVTLGLPFNTMAVFFITMLGFYIFMLAMGCNAWLSMIGAVIYALGSYNLIIIDAGHISKALVMATMAPVLGGIILCYRKKYVWGIIVTLLFTGLNIAWNHQQITYYLLLTIIPLAIVYLIDAIRHKTVPDFFKSSAILIVVAMLALLPAADKLLPTMDFAKETMRGGAVLKSDEPTKESSGLDIDYAFQWSYGKAETFTLLIPNMYGGSSHYNLGKDSKTYEVLRNTGQASQFVRYAPMYWGDQPFTSGPVYIGAIICFLFLLGMIICKGPDRWWILAATIIAFIFSWGRHFMPLNDFFFHHLPLYNKFRTPSMSLVIASVTMVTMAMLAIKKVMESDDKKQFLKPLYISAGITLGITLIFALFGGSMFSFSAASDANYPDWLVDALQEDRRSMLTKDAWRSFAFILLAAGLLWIYIVKAFKKQYLYIGLGLLMFVDMWGVDHRFFNNDNFVPKRKSKEFIPSQIDQYIMQDTALNYRVLNMTTNTFNESNTSYFHNSVGGYSPAKLRRYQDIIDYYFVNTLNPNILNMLNTHYVIFPTQQGNQVQRNDETLGNVWFVDSIDWVNNPNEEIEAIGVKDLARVAVIDTVWRKDITIPIMPLSTDSTATISLVKMPNPDYMVYQSQSNETHFAVFSEIFYKTWKVYIDGVEAPIVRTDYILRGVVIPAGNHNIEFKCVDQVYVKSHTYSLIASIVVCAIVVLLLAFASISKKRKNKK